ncbi:ABC transporter ATP-binding protein [Paenibacillus sp. F411]|uniref:ABC transporter ATP-binding protein n=1 Tax=Paenibacillus sp. F411 TaxID=2820239 RepID=UPI001AAF2E0C|nr:ABC transporter ATP-binding protein [Paenibacillus sp. F411]
MDAAGDGQIRNTLKNKWSAYQERRQTYFWVLSYLKPYRGSLIALIVMGLVLALGEISIPQFLRYLIDVVVPEKSNTLFFTALAVLILVLGLMFAATALCNILERSVQEKAARDLQLSLFTHLRKLGFAYYEQHPTGETLSLFNHNLTAVQKIYTQYLPLIIRHLLLILVPLVMVLHMNTKLTLFILPCYFLYYLIGPTIDGKTAMYFKQQTQERERLNQKIYNSVSSLVEVRAFGATSWEVGRFTETYEQYAKTRLGSLLYRHLQFSFRMTATAVGVILMYILGSQSITSGSMSVGTFVSFTIYILMIFRSIGRLTFQLLEQSYCIGQAQLLYEYAQHKPVVQEDRKPRFLSDIAGALTFSEVHFSYPGRSPVITGFTAQILPGQKTALVGTSGCGKSTLLKLVGRFYDPDQGQILLDGVPLTELSLSQIRESIGIVFQETYLFGLSIQENIRFGRPDASQADIIAAAKAAFIHDFILELPEGYDTLVGERGIRLSGGQKQRIAIARMFIKNPSIILLDEATASLDTVSEKAVQHALQALLASRTTIAVAHRISTIRDYDQIIVIDQGKAVEQGTYEELVRQQGIFYQLVKGEELHEEQLGLDMAIHT